MTLSTPPGLGLTLQPHMRIKLRNEVVATDGTRLAAGSEALASIDGGTSVRLNGDKGQSVTASLSELSGSELAGCTCEWADGGNGESGPSPYISEPSPLCPEHGAHTEEWQEGLELQRGHELSLLCHSLEVLAREADAFASSHAGGIRAALELVRSSDAGRKFAAAQQEAEEAWEQQQESSNR